MPPSSEPAYDSGLVWFRRDLRAEDHAALHHALRQCQQVHCVFVFDRAILDALPADDRRMAFIHASVTELDDHLRQLSAQPGAGLITLHGVASDDIPRIAQTLGVQAVFANHDDEPDALARDALVRTRLSRQGMALHTSKDHCVFERSEILTQTGQPYSVFTPYKNAWLRKVTEADLQAHAIAPWGHRLAARPVHANAPVPTLKALGFGAAATSPLKLPTGRQGALQLLEAFATRIQHYHERRDFPHVKGPSYLSVHLRFGTLSIREAARLAHARHLQGCEGASVWLSELIWRDFYFQILAHHPQVASASFKPAYDAIEWDTGPQADTLFDAWCQGQTGYPLVDAAMRQLLQTGYMHNRLRMVTASFLTKDLGIDWRRGEQWFARLLLDFDLSANNGGWQWASSSGCDAQPYFRIFNPISQSTKFDPQGQFIRRYVPELSGLSDKAIHAPWQASPIERQAAQVTLGVTYPHPIVDHAEAREKTLARYAVVKTAA